MTFQLSILTTVYLPSICHQIGIKKNCGKSRIDNCLNIFLHQIQRLLYKNKFLYIILASS